MNPFLLGGLAACAVAVAAAAVRPLACRDVPQSHSTDGPARPARPPGPLARRTAQQLVARAYPDALDAIVLAVRAGYLPLAALQATVPHVAAPLRAAFTEVVQRTHAGERFADALSCLPARLGPVASPLADSFAAADRDGLPLAPVLERLAEEARQRRRRQADALARQLPVRMSLPLVLCTLPAFVFLAIVPLLLAALSSLQQ